MTDSAVAIRGVTHRYGDFTALRDVTLAVPGGLLFGLLGPNGGGKTTLFRILATLLAPSEGAAAILGLDTVREAAGVRQRIGMVFQHAALDGDLTLRENLRVQGALYGLRGRALHDRIDHLLGVFGVADRDHERVRALSGGLLRRGDLARGLLHRPAVLLLDEPTTGLDPVARHAFWHALARLRREEGTTLVVATHLLEEAAYCDRVGILERGRLVVEGEPDALRRHLGDETLWIEADEAEALAADIRGRFGLDVRHIGDGLQVSHPEAHTLLPALYGAYAPRIRSATVRRPTLEDVFMAYAGYRLGEEGPQPDPNTTPAP